MKVRSNDTHTAVRFDPEAKLALPRDVNEFIENGKTFWYWRDSQTCIMYQIKPGDWLVTSDRGGYTAKLDDSTFRAMYEEIPHAGEGGG
jgi:lysylphosphatidylglycerol synthetase-like protein (DUF2156 family)